MGGLGGFEELGGAGFLGAAGVEVVAHHQEKRIIGREIRGAMHGVAVAEGLGLRDEAHLPGERAGGGGVGGLIAGANDHRDFGDARGGDFLGEDGEGGFRHTIAVHERLEREHALVFSGGGDDGFGDFHDAKAERFPQAGNSL